MISFSISDGLHTAKYKTDTATEMIVEMVNFSMDSAKQLAVIILKNEDFIIPHPNQSDWIVNSQIIGISTKNNLKFSNHQYIDIHLKPANAKLHEAKKCVFWNYSLNLWSPEGCELVDEHIVAGFDTCRCRHMTIFTELILPIKMMKEMSNDHVDHVAALTWITYFGCFISSCGLIIVFVTATIFEHWRNEFSNKIYLNLSATFANLLLIFSIDSAVSSQTNNNIICLVFGGFLHYSVLAVFLWMLITAVLSYKKLVVVFNNEASHRLLKISLCGWIIPLIPVILLLSINSSSYTKHDDDSVCYPSDIGYWAAVFAPILLIVFANSIFYIVIVYKVFIKTSIERNSDDRMNREKVCASIMLFFLFGLTWIFGFFSKIPAMNFLFCITAPIQGFVLFVFVILINPKTRKMWREKLMVHFSESRNDDVANNIRMNEIGLFGFTIKRPSRSKTNSTRTNINPIS